MMRLLRLARDLCYGTMRHYIVPANVVFEVGGCVCMCPRVYRIMVWSRLQCVVACTDVVDC